MPTKTKSKKRRKKLPPMTKQQHEETREAMRRYLVNHGADQIRANVFIQYTKDGAFTWILAKVGFTRLTQREALYRGRPVKYWEDTQIGWYKSIAIPADAKKPIKGVDRF